MFDLIYFPYYFKRSIAQSSSNLSWGSQFSSLTREHGRLHFWEMESGSAVEACEQHGSYKSTVVASEAGQSQTHSRWLGMGEHREKGCNYSKVCCKPTYWVEMYNFNCVCCLNKEVKLCWNDFKSARYGRFCLLTRHNVAWAGGADDWAAGDEQSVLLRQTHKKTDLCINGGIVWFFLKPGNAAEKVITWWQVKGTDLMAAPLDRISK